MLRFLKTTILKIRNSWFLIAFSILLLSNICLRVIFIFYGYIATDEGISLYNSKLAYSHLMPFIDYNGWNSLITDYVVGVTHLFIHSTIFTQRLFGFSMAMVTILCTLLISNQLGGKKEVLATLLLLTFGSPLYLYFSNIPYSSQLMTCLLMATFFLLCKASANRASPLFYDALAVILATINLAVRSQTIPIFITICIYLWYLRRANMMHIAKLVIVALSTGLLIFLPFLIRSIPNTLYGLFWPFFASKILLYVADIPPRSLLKLETFIFTSIQEYGIYFSLLFSAILTNARIIKNRHSALLMLFCIILCIALFTALIHNPADASYIYPFAPLLSIMASFALIRIVELVVAREAKHFIYVCLISVICMQFLSYPHYKLLKTSLQDIQRTPHDYVHEISTFIKDRTDSNDAIITFYLPVVAEIERSTPLHLNEGPGSISILDSKTANFYHLTSISDLKRSIESKEVKMLVFADSFIRFLGRTKADQDEMLALIQNKYVLIKSFPDFHLTDGSNAKALYIYALP